MSRGYQTGLYTQHHALRDHSSRTRKADKIARALRSAALSLSTATCLDIGCSSGTITQALSPLFARTIGLEYDRAALSEANPSACESVLLVCGDAMCLPLADASVDVILCAQVYEHVPDASRLIAEIYRVLAPGGVVFFSGPNWLFPVEPHYHLPFLHWLPAPLAARYLQITKRGDSYYEQLRTVWGLRRMLRHFAVRDVTHVVLEDSLPPSLWALARSLPVWIWGAVQPIAPNFNWILSKIPTESD